MSRRRPPAGDVIPGTAVSLPRRTAECVLAATARPVKPVGDQGDLVEHWHECRLLTDEQRAKLDGGSR